MNVGEFGEENNGWKNRGCDYRENEVDWVGMKFCVPALSLLAMAVARFADQERNIAEPFCVSNDLSGLARNENSTLAEIFKQEDC
jgi:hypothetical protein